jgi:KEOPS complex subunit Pcc1
MHTLSVDFDLGPRAKRVYDSLGPELQEIPSERSKVNLELAGDVLRLSIAAEDVVSLRAAVNTWLRLIRIAEDMLNIR